VYPIATILLSSVMTYYFRSAMRVHSGDLGNLHIARDSLPEKKKKQVRKGR
jgi:hypothetical protein